MEKLSCFTSSENFYDQVLNYAYAGHAQDTIDLTACSGTNSTCGVDLDTIKRLVVHLFIILREDILLNLSAIYVFVAINYLLTGRRSVFCKTYIADKFPILYLSYSIK